MVNVKVVAKEAFGSSFESQIGYREPECAAWSFLFENYCNGINNEGVRKYKTKIVGLPNYQTIAKSFNEAVNWSINLKFDEGTNNLVLIVDNGIENNINRAETDCCANWTAEVEILKV